jgi:hypothetical protein
VQLVLAERWAERRRRRRKEREREREKREREWAKSKSEVEKRVLALQWNSGDPGGVGDGDFNAMLNSRVLWAADRSTPPGEREWKKEL